MKPESVEISSAEERLQTAKNMLDTAIKQAQEKCPHEKVGETAGPLDGEGRILRVCLVCGLGTANAFGHYGVLGEKDRLVYKLTGQQAVALRRTHGR